MLTGRLTYITRIFLISTIVLPVLLITASVAQAESYPPIPEGQYAGSVWGIVSKTRITTDILAGANLSLVSDTDSSVVYATLQSDENGRYQFQGVSPGGYYRIIASKKGFSEVTTGSFSVPSGGRAVQMIILPQLVAITPTPGPALPDKGSVAGRVYIKENNAGVTYTSIALVNPTSPDIIYNNSNTDEDGNYRFDNVKGDSTDYQLLVTSRNYGTVYSFIFKVSPEKTTNMDIVISDPNIKVPTPTEEPTVQPSDGSPTPTKVPLPPQSPGFEFILVLAGAGLAAAYRSIR